MSWVTHSTDKKAPIIFILYSANTHVQCIACIFGTATTTTTTTSMTATPCTDVAVKLLFLELQKATIPFQLVAVVISNKKES